MEKFRPIPKNERVVLGAECAVQSAFRLRIKPAPLTKGAEHEREETGEGER